MNNYNDNYNPFKEEGNALIYKDHKDFFDRFHELRAFITEKIGESLFDGTSLKPCLSYMEGLIQWTSIYIQKMNKLEEIEKDFDECVTLLKTNKSKEARRKVISLYQELNKIYEFNELIPQVKVVEKEQEDIDVLTKHALAAYKIINCVK